MLDKFKDECGVFGIFGHPEAANLTYLGLYALQHRGQESAGIVTADGERMRCPGILRSDTRAIPPPAKAGSTTPSLS
jgi:glutamate synthase domain-containing protein 1